MTRNPWAAAVLVLLACVLCYANSLRGSFHYDDFHSIVDNPGIRSLASAPAFFSDPSLFSADVAKGMYRPVLLTTYALNYAVGGYDVVGYHLVNLALHVICSLLVWRLALHLLGHPSTALVCGLVFAVHPLGTEPVNYISSRSELLVAAFYLAALLTYLTSHGRASCRWGSLTLFALALLSKSTAISLPVLLLAHEVLVSRPELGRARPWGWYARRHGPCWGLAFLYFAIIAANGFLGKSLSAPVRDEATQLATQMKAVPYYLKLLVLPAGLNVEHQFFEAGGFSDAPVLVGAALAASLILVMALACYSGRRLAGFLMVWGAVVLIPTFIMPLNVLVNERRLYLVMAGFVLLLGELLGRSPVVRRCGWGMAACLVPLIGLTISRNSVWADELTLWRDAESKAPGMYRVQTNLGKAKQETGDWSGALAAYQRALGIDDGHGDAPNNIATILHLQGQVDEAVQWYRRALERYPNHAKIRQNLADALVQLGDLPAAHQMYESALALASTDGAIWSNYGEALVQAGEWDRAEAALGRAIELIPDQPEPYNNLANAYSGRDDQARAVDLYRQALSRSETPAAAILANLGDSHRRLGSLDEARRALLQAIEADADFARSHYYLGQTEVLAGRWSEADAAFAEASRLDPHHVPTVVARAELAGERGDLGKAARLLARAIEIEPGNSRAWYGLGETYQAQGDRARAIAAYQRFLETWPHADQRARQVADRIRVLESGQ